MSGSYSIRAVSERTGLSAHTIRAWERRYGVLEPGRTDSNRRVYGELDIERLLLLRNALAQGHTIGMVASLPTETLRDMVRPAPGLADPMSEDLLGECMASIRSLDSEALDSALRRGLALRGIDAFLTEVAGPLLNEIDRGWTRGSLGVSHEHLASALLRTHLERIRLSLEPKRGASRILVTTPAGQIHELGALMVAVTAARMGWHVTYLGSNTPAADIARAAEQTGAQAVALSIVHPEADYGLHEELRELRKRLGETIPILVGGRAAESYRKTLVEIGAVYPPDASSIREALSNFRSPGRPN